MKAARLQIALPPQVNLSGLTAQSFGPACQRHVDCASMIGGQIGRETKQYKLLFAACSRFAGTVQNRAPVFLADVMVNQLPDAPVGLFRGGLALVIPMFDLLMFEVGVEGAKSATVRAAPAAAGGVSRGVRDAGALCG